jgi:hypothetical protein
MNRATGRFGVALKYEKAPRVGATPWGAPPLSALWPVAAWRHDLLVRITLCFN